MGADEIYSQYRQKFRACGGQKPARNLITPPLQSTPVTSQEAVDTPGFRPCFHEESMGVTGGFLYFGGGSHCFSTYRAVYLDVSRLYPILIYPDSKLSDLPKGAGGDLYPILIP